MSRLAVGLVLVAAVLLALGAMHAFQPDKTGDKSSRDAFAQDRDPNPAEPLGFDADRAMGYLKEICKIGPRISGTEGIKKEQELLKKHFEAKGGKVTFQRFTARQKSRPNKPIEMANIIVAWNPERLHRVILCSHYDTRPIADKEPDRTKWEDPFISANDGGSGVALLMELANHMKELKTEVGVDFVFFDGEEYIFEPDRDDYFFGSREFAQTYRKTKPKYKYQAGVLLDMIGGKNAHFPWEPNSAIRAGALVEELWAIADKLGCNTFQKRYGQYAIQDDHLALNDAKIPTVDIIDFEYPHWHKLTDLPENCSGDSLKEVAQVLTVWLQRIK
jgi:hypothetical protein